MNIYYLRPCCSADLFTLNFADDLLEIPGNANASDIKKAYRKQVNILF